MRRLDYQLVSQAMNDAKPRLALGIQWAGAQEVQAQWERGCNLLADAFTEQTPAFERARFLKDCGFSPAAISHPVPRT